MPRLSSQHALARRALLQDIQQHQSSWIQHGVAALAVSVLGLGVAGSVLVTGSAHQYAGNADQVSATQTTVNPGVAVPSAFDREVGISRGNVRPSIDPARISSAAHQRAETLTKTEARVATAARSKAAAARGKQLAMVSAATHQQAERIKANTLRAAAARRSSSTTTNTTSAVPSAIPATGTRDGRASMPIASGYTIAARFGAIGKWSRYHTGFDFSAPVGTPIHAPETGVVTTAGSGAASGWAGRYVTVRHPDGTSSLYAHMSTVSVSVGQKVSAGQVVGSVGMTGRTFGPHVHFEIYPAGVAPGDLYRAVNPEPWLQALGLQP